MYGLYAKSMAFYIEGLNYSDFSIHGVQRTNLQGYQGITVQGMNFSNTNHNYYVHLFCYNSCIINGT